MRGCTFMTDRLLAGRRILVGDDPEPRTIDQFRYRRMKELVRRSSTSKPTCETHSYAAPLRHQKTPDHSALPLGKRAHGGLRRLSERRIPKGQHCAVRISCIELPQRMV